MLKKKAQSLTEYSVCLAVVLVALITMNLYVKRGLQGRYKDLVDYTVDKVSDIRQYEPYYVDSEHTTITNTTTGEIMSNGGSFTRTIDDTSIRPIWRDTEKINCYEDE